MNTRLPYAFCTLVYVRFLLLLAGIALLPSRISAQTEQQVWIQEWAWQELVPERVVRTWVPESTELVWIPPVTEDIWVPASTQLVWVPPVTHTETVPDQTHEEYYPAATREVFYPAEGYYVPRDAEIIEIYHPRISHFEQYPAQTHIEYYPGYWESYWVDEYGWVCDFICEWVYDPYSEGGGWECWDDNCRVEWIGWYEEWYWVEGYEEEVVDNEAWEEEVVDQEEHIEYVVVREAGEEFVETRPARTETEQVSPAWTDIVVDTWKVITVVDHEGHYTTEHVPGYWSTNEIPGYWDNVTVSGYHEDQTVPQHWQTRVTPGHWSTVFLPHPNGTAPGAWDYESIAHDAERYYRADPVRFVSMMPDWGWDRIFNESGWSETEVYDRASLVAVRDVRVADALPFAQSGRHSEELIEYALRNVLGFDPQISIRAVLGTVGFDQSFDRIYGWNWEEVPGYPVGRVWDGVTIGPDFPQWNWQNWPHDWFMTSAEDDDPALVAFFGEGPEARLKWEQAERLRQIQKLQKARRIAHIGRSSLVGLTAAMLIEIWLQQEIERLQRDGPWSYVVYEKLQPVTGRVYAGHSQGPGDPISVMQRRDSQHVVKNFVEGYYAADINAYVVTLGAGSVFGYSAMWGREQQVMDYHGGAVSDRGGYNVAGEFGRMRCSNKIRTIAKGNLASMGVWLTSNSAFGPLSRYTGYPMIGIVPPMDRPIISMGAVGPFFFPY